MGSAGAKNMCQNARGSTAPASAASDRPEPLAPQDSPSFSALLRAAGMGKASTPPPPPPAEEFNVAVPAMFGFCGVGVGAIGFGAGYGARSYFTTAAYKELLEKFPDAPTAEAENLARGGATRAFLAGTALAGMMGVGAVMTARMYGITTAAQLGDEIKKWLPTQAKLEVRRGTLVSPARATPQLTRRPMCVSVAVCRGSAARAAAAHGH